MKKKKVKKSSRKRVSASSRESVAALKKTIAVQAQQIREAAEQQTAMSEILRVIASSPTDLQPVLDVVAANAARLCKASDALIVRVKGDNHIPVASYGTLAPTHGISTSRGSPAGRAILDRQTLHIRDLAVEVETEFPEVADFQKRFGHRTMLATPLLREGIGIGAILIRRLEVNSFTDSQIKLLETFADQAVIAIENVRLFQELQVRNRDLTEALEQQTATGEVLCAISGSPTDLQPVFGTILANTTRLCEANIAALFLYDGEFLTTVAHYGTTREFAEFLKGTRRSKVTFSPANTRSISGSSAS